MRGEWHSYAPDGREVVVRREGEFWLVECGASYARSTNLDAALVRAIREDTEVMAHTHRVDFPTWIRSVADTLEPDAEA
jgi:hypothetical protein